MVTVSIDKISLAQYRMGQGLYAGVLFNYSVHRDADIRTETGSFLLERQGDFLYFLPIIAEIGGRTKVTGGTQARRRSAP